MRHCICSGWCARQNTDTHSKKLSAIQSRLDAHPRSPPRAHHHLATTSASRSSDKFRLRVFQFNLSGLFDAFMFGAIVLCVVHTHSNSEWIYVACVLRVRSLYCSRVAGTLHGDGSRVRTDVVCVVHTKYSLRLWRKETMLCAPRARSRVWQLVSHAPTMGYHQAASMLQ